MNVDTPRETVRTRLPTASGEFTVIGFESSTRFTYLALIKGDIGEGRSVLCRIHSECLTGDSFGSLRCDCGPQLRASLARIAAEGRGVLVYVTGHEGRGIGLINKLLAYRLQDDGLDTVDANLGLHLPVDARNFDEAALVLTTLGVRSVRLLTNNPVKVTAVEAAGIEVDEIASLPIVPHARNRRYLQTKQDRMGHLNGVSSSPKELIASQDRAIPDVTELIGEVRSHNDRPHVILKFAQTLDGRLATRTGDSKWISGPEERRMAHAMRAFCDAVLVGSGTVRADDPRLTVRLVTGASPIRVVLDSDLRLTHDHHVFDDEAPTMVFTARSPEPDLRRALDEGEVGFRTVAPSADGIDLEQCLSQLKAHGVETLLVEGGARVITSFMKHELADRIVVSVSPMMIGTGVSAVEDLRIDRVCDAVKLENRSVFLAGNDIVIAGDMAFKDSPTEITLPSATIRL